MKVPATSFADAALSTTTSGKLVCDGRNNETSKDKVKSVADTEDALETHNGYMGMFRRNCVTY